MSQNNTNLHNVNLSQLKNILSNYYDTRIPLYLWGRPSTAKTSSVRQFAKEKAEELGLKYSEDVFGPEYFTMKVITLSQYDSPDLRGMPRVTGDNGSAVTEFIPTVELPREGQGILFFDEMNLADDQTRAACYQLILEGRYGAMPPVTDANGKHTYWRLAASNRENDFSNVNISSLALLRRFAHLAVDPEVDEVVKYFMSEGLDPRVIAFIKNFQEDLFPQKWDEKLLENKANPFPSTWENVAKLIEKLPTTKETEGVIFNLTASCVGAPVASKFLSYIKLVSTLDMEKIIDEPEKILPEIIASENKAALLYAISFNLSSRWYKKDKKLTAEKSIKICDLMPPEFAASLIIGLLSRGPNKVSRERELATVPNFDKTLTRLGKFYDFNN
jgi:hypothetical protein